MPAAGARRRGGAKPIDTGSGVVCASLSRSGAWLSLARVHARHGFVELSGMVPFDERLRGDPAAVRAYRALMAHDASAFLAVEPFDSVMVTSRLVRPIPGAEHVEQQLRLRRTDGDAPLGARLRFRGRLDRPALAMITEPGGPGSPAGLPGAVNRLVAAGSRLHVDAPELETSVTIEIEPRGAARRARWQLDEAGAGLALAWPRGVSEAWLAVRCCIALDGAPHRASISVPAGRPSLSTGLSASLEVPPDLARATDEIRRRAVRNVRQCTALRVGPGRVAILTDHRLLPLSWTRDAYWQALLLLREGDVELVGDHLRWLWLDCHRPRQAWARSHHADGRRADDIYQADQQLYPLLELADYGHVTGSLPTLDSSAAAEEAWTALVAPVLADLDARSRGEGLLATDENAADDPASLPYILANQVLAWRALNRLAEVPQLDRLRPAALAMAGRLAGAIDRHFQADGPTGPMWPYAVDGRGQAVLMHDANDVPTVLAPGWGFCAPDDARWRGTVAFAFGPANGAWAAGPYGGLGSHHTAGVWSLGLIQEWIARCLTGERDLAADALRRLLACALSDWSLPEASDPATGRIVARQWFAWPGALLGSLLPRR